MTRAGTTRASGVLAASVLLSLLVATGCGEGDETPAATGPLLPASIDADTRLPAGEYVAETSIVVTGDSLLVLEPGVTIRFARGVGMTVLTDGRLRAVGTPEKPITLTGVVRERGFWNGLHFSSSGSTDNVLDHVTIEYAGGHEFFGWPIARADLVLSGSASRPTRIHVTNCTLRESAGSGFFTDENVEVAAFAGNTVTSNAAGAGTTSVCVAGFLDTTTTYAGNDEDVVYLSGGDVATDQVWRALDAEYVLTTSTTVHAALTVGAGAVLRFVENVGLTVLTGGSLTAVGTPEKPIRFGGTKPVPGHWNGLFLRDSDSPLNRLDHATVEYGGGYEFFGWESARTDLVLKSSRIHIARCTFRSSAGWGVWVSADSTVNDDLENMNTFSDNAAGNVFRQD